MTERSFIKWVGGKYRSIYQLLDLFPPEFKTYYEPFMGSGVVFFNLQPPESILNDVEYNLVNTFRSVKRDVSSVISELESYNNDAESYYDIRDDFNNSADIMPGRKGAQFIYMNKCGYNGLYRVNKKGEINVSFGKRDGSPHKDFYNLKECSLSLNKARIMNTDYKEILDMSRCGDFVYMDPPYHKETSKSFVGYNAKEFTERDHERLALECEFLTKRGVLFALSNSNTDFIKNLYKNYNIYPIYTARTVSCDVSRRSQAKEILVTNYDKGEIEVS